MTTYYFRGSMLLIVRLLLNKVSLCNSALDTPNSTTTNIQLPQNRSIWVSSRCQLLRNKASCCKFVASFFCQINPQDLSCYYTCTGASVKEVSGKIKQANQRCSEQFPLILEIKFPFIFYFQSFKATRNQHLVHRNGYQLFICFVVKFAAIPLLILD